MERKELRFVQKRLAGLIGCSLSTVSHALERPRSIGAVRVTGRFGEVTEIRKLLIYWATIQRLGR